MEAGYFEHDADIGIIGRGTTVEEAFVSAAHAMFAIQAGLDAVQSRERIELDFEEDDAELALVRWLNALLAASNERGMALREFGLARAGARWGCWPPWTTRCSSRSPTWRGSPGWWARR